MERIARRDGLSLEVESGVPALSHRLRAVLIHQQPSGRDYARERLEGRTLSVVAEARAHDDALSLVRALRPDVVVAQLLPDSPDQTGFQFADRLRREAPGTATVLVGEMGAGALSCLDALARASGAAGVLPYAALSAQTLASLLASQ